MLDYLVIIQARLYSTRLPGKVLMTVGGIPMVKRIWNAAKEAMKCRNAKVIVAWPERYPDLNENNVLERFRRIALEFPSEWIIRLTADCPLITSLDIKEAIYLHNKYPSDTWNNYRDGHDVQIFKSSYLSNTHLLSKEHVIKDPIPTIDTGLSVNTYSDLCRVRTLVEKSSLSPAVQEPSAKLLSKTL